MRTVDSTFNTAIADGNVRLTILIILELVDGTIHRITQHLKNITWDSGNNVYTAYPAEGQPVSYSTDSTADSLTIKLANISGDIATSVRLGKLDGAKITVKRIRWDDTYAANREIILFIGNIKCKYNNRELTIECKSLEDSLNIKYPENIFQEACNHTLFDVRAKKCLLTRVDYAYARTATGGTTESLIDATRGTIYKLNFDGGNSTLPIVRGETITGQTGLGTAKVVQIVYLTANTGTLWYVELSGTQFVNDEQIKHGTDLIVANGTPAEDLAFYEKGELEMLTGNNAGQRRTIFSNNGSTILLFCPLPYAVAAGDTYKIYPGCDGTWQTCKERFNNLVNYFGFPGMPNIKDVFL